MHKSFIACFIAVVRTPEIAGTRVDPSVGDADTSIISIPSTTDERRLFRLITDLTNGDPLKKPQIMQTNEEMNHTYIVTN